MKIHLSETKFLKTELKRLQDDMQALAAPVQEPVDGTQVSKVWWDGEKLMAKPIPLEDIYQPVDWKAEYLKSVESGCITLDELREANAELAATNRQVEILSDALAESRREVAALKANAALDKKAENARELGLDYEPAPVQKRPPNCGTSYCSCIECIMPPARPAPVKVWEAEGYDALMQEMQMVKARNIRQHAEIERLKAAQPAVQEPFGYVYEAYCLPECACEMEWVESFDRYEPDAEENIRNVTPVYTTPPAAQPAVPDAFGTREGEHPQYIQGWNDCRAEMLKSRGNT